MRRRQRPFPRAARLINEAKKPVIVAGQGVSIAKAEAELRQLAEKANIPVATSLLGIGTFPATHPLSISWGGMHGEAYCNYALQECDVLFAIGARLDDRLTGAFDTFAPNAKIIHVDLDPAEMGKNITIDTPVIGDALLTLRNLLPQVEPNEHPPGWSKSPSGKRIPAERDILAQETDELIAPYVMRTLWHATDEGARHRRQRCGPAPDVGSAVLPSHPAAQFAHLRWVGHDGLRSACSYRRTNGAARRRNLGRGWRRRLPNDDDRAVYRGAGETAHQNHHH
jgi:thiamine pyrophosphate-dependent acetolactate synthase large subunit-like protein